MYGEAFDGKPGGVRTRDGDAESGADDERFHGSLPPTRICRELLWGQSVELQPHGLPPRLREGA